MLPLAVAFLSSTIVTLLIVRMHHGRSRPAGNRPAATGPQDFHDRPTPRIGGLSIVFAIATLLVVAWWNGAANVLQIGGPLLACGLPAFLGGMAEDLTRRVGPLPRMLAAATAAGLAVHALGATIDRTDLWGLDWLASYALGAAGLAVFAVTGIVNAVNIIDGFNGLASMCVVLMLAGLTYVATQVGDTVIVTLALAGIGAVLGFFIWNFPAGMVFLGDGGAYFLGFYVAELGILLLNRNPEVSPLCPLLMCIYPIFETLFSIYRKKFLRGISPGMPDGVHLHMLVYKRLLRFGLGKETAKAATRRNSMTSPYLWSLCMIAVVPAVLFWDRSAVLGWFIVLFGLLYVIVYWRIVRFKTPNWLIVRR